MERRHSLKTWPEPFYALREGTKTFEYRKNDRGFAKGDILVLRLWDPGIPTCLGRPGGYSDGRFEVFDEEKALTIRKRVTYILHGGQMGVPEGYCVMGLADIPTEAPD